MDKNELRGIFKKVRENISDKELKSNLITKKVMDTKFYKEVKVIALYCSFSNEVDTLNLINNSLLDGKTVVLPVTTKEEMKFYRISSIEEIKCINSFGIREPLAKDINLITSNKIDLMIIPGICFDKAKNRIGFGKGYYDKYLIDANNIVKMGICFDEQLLKSRYIVSDEHDVKMDMIITDKKIY